MSPIEAETITYSIFVTDELVTVPVVDCGEGYRQLEWLEPIEECDEYYGGTDAHRVWLPALDIGARYRPHTANSFYAPYAIHRRKLVVDALGVDVR